MQDIKNKVNLRYDKTKLTLQKTFYKNGTILQEKQAKIC